MVPHRISLVIIEDDDALRQGLSLFLKRKSQFEVLADYGCGEDSLKEILPLNPHVALVDLVLPDQTGAELIEKLKEMLPSLQCLVFSSMETEDWVFEALKKGADGYLVKTEGFERVASALEEIVLQGGTPISPHIARRIVQEFQSPREHLKEETENAKLTPREEEILDLLARGLSYKEIAGQMVVSPQTIATHVKKIYRKLHATNKAEALLRQKKMII